MTVPVFVYVICNTCTPVLASSGILLDEVNVVDKSRPVVNFRISTLSQVTIHNSQFILIKQL
jgi:hypothetical protein